MSDKETAVIILAAGKGTRMKSSTPKILHRVCGRSMVEHVIDNARKLKADRIITVVSPDFSEQLEFIKSLSQLVVQQEQLGTADAVKPALELLKDFDGNVIILYADTPLIKDSTVVQMTKKLNDVDVVVLGFRPADAAEYGRLVVNDDKLEDIIEYKDATDTQRSIDLCNSGVIAVRSKVLKECLPQIDNNNKKNEYYLTDIIKIANQNKKLCSYIECEEDEVIGVNNRQQLSEVEYILQQRLRENAMINGVTLIDPETVYFSYDTKLGKDVVIEPNVVFGQLVVIDDNVRIKSFSHIEDAIISSDCVIGPFARIRPGTKIAKDVRIGNFVEIKKSKIGKNTKIGHLSYIGDAQISDNVNIGAGTVTCNYDGKNKHVTTIESGAFIGSNSSFVAPVQVGKDSLVAAGSTITKDIDNKKLAIARSRQINKDMIK